MFKKFIIETAIDLILQILKDKRERGKTKLADFLFSESMQNTLATVNKEYLEALTEWEG